MTLEQRIAVLGADGSLLSTIMDLIPKKHFVVRGYDNFSKRSRLKEAGIRMEEPKLCEYADLRVRANVTKIVREHDIIILGATHLFGAIGLRTNGLSILQNEVEIMSNLSRAVSDNKIRRLKHVIYISSSIVYEGLKPPYSEVDSEFNQFPTLAYAKSKVIAEELLKSLCEYTDVSYTIWRPFNIVDPREISLPKAGMSHIIPDMIKQICHYKKMNIELIGSAETTRAFCHVDDVATAIVNNITNKETRNQTFNVGSPQETSMFDLVQTIYAQAYYQGIVKAPIGDFIITENNPGFDKISSRYPNIDKLMIKLNWRRTRYLPSIILDAIQYYETNLKEIYTNLDKLKTDKEQSK